MIPAVGDVSEQIRVMSALPPKADIRRRNCDVCCVPNADIRRAGCKSKLALQAVHGLT
jgi:hypothetical protein